MITNKYKRIAILGSSGVGKTTLFDRLFTNSIIQARYKPVPEQVRLLCQMRAYSSPYEIPENEIHQFRKDVLDSQIKAEIDAINFIADRSTIDAWIYYMRWSWNTTTVEETENFYQKAINHSSHYDLLIYLPIRFDLVDDKFRWANIDYQKQIDRLFLQFLSSDSRLYQYDDDFEKLISFIL